MNTSFKPQYKLLLANVLLALASMATGQHAYADLVDNGDGTFTCTGDCNNVDTSIKGIVNIDTSGAAATFNNTTIDALANPNSSDPLAPEYGALIRYIAPNVSAAGTINVTGGNPVVINNRGTIDLSTFDPVTFIPTRSFDPTGWTYDEVTRQLFNNGVEVGYAAAILAIGNTPSLTVNNFVGDNPFLDPNFFQPVAGQILGSGDLTSGIYTNAPLLTVNGDFETVKNGVGVIPSSISKIASFGGGSYTPPAVQDGTQFATNVTAGTTVFNANVSDLYVVDRNPLLTEAEALSGLTLANSQADVGPRNSIITGIFTNAYLGSGNHVINHPATENGLLIGTINVDQSAVAVSDVVGGVSTPLYFVHGERKFTLNASQSIFNPITINDVAGAVNTINATGLAGSITALNGTGDNTLNLNCLVINQCSNTGSLSGFTTMNVTGLTTTLDGNFSVSGDINLLNGTTGFRIVDANGSLASNNSILSGSASLTASRIIIGPQAYWKDAGGSIGSITGNLINRGNLDLGTATLNVDGNVNMEAGSKLALTVANAQQGNIKVTGTNTVSFSPQSTLLPSVQERARINEGFSFIAANNVSGIPLVQAPGFLQWIPSLSGADLLLTANIDIPSFLAGQVTPAANNALNAVFSYTDNAALPMQLQTELLQITGGNLIGTAERLRPEINDGTFRMVQGNTDKVFGILENRLLASYLPSSLEPVKVAANGDVNGLGSTSTTGKGVWVQGFGDRGIQERLKGIDGYNSSATGFAFGVDNALDAVGNQRVGVAFGYAHGNVTNSGYTANNRTDINSYLGAAYGSLVADGWYVNGMLGVGRNTYDSYRNLIDYTATGNHDSWQFSGRVDVGMPILVDDNWSLVPMATLDYSHIKESGYTENGKDNRIAKDPTSGQPIVENGLPVFTTSDSPINLKIASRSFDSIRGGLGGKVIYSLQEPGWGADIELHGLYRHEFGDVAQNSTAQFTFGGNQFSSPGLRPDRNSLLLGGSVRLTADDEDDQFTFLSSYDAELREKYLGQIVSLNVRYDFDQAPKYIKGAKAKLAAQVAKQVREEKVDATQKDIANIKQAMQSEPEFKQEEVLDANQQAIDSTIKTWLTAQSNKNMEVYFNSYAADFSTPDGSNRHLWERNRRNELDKEDHQAIKISYLSIKPQGNRALAMFTQTKATADKQVAVRKLIDLENRNGRWLIVREDSMSVEK